LSGSQLITDKYETLGEEYYSDDANSTVSANIQLKKQTNILERTLEQTISKVETINKDLQDNYSTTEEMNSAITQTSESIKSEVSKTYATSSSLASTEKKLTGQISDVDGKIDSLSSDTQDALDNLQGQIDGAIETYVGSETPTLTNYPANKWTDDKTKNNHIGDLYYVQTDGDTQGFCYRFQLNNGSYEWVLLKDSEITKAIQEASEAMAKATSVGNDLADNYSTTDEVNSAISDSATDTLSAASSDATTKANQAKSAAIADTVSRLKSYSTTSEVDAKIEQNADSIKSEVSANYTTKLEFDNLSIGGRNYLVGTATPVSRTTTATSGYIAGRYYYICNNSKLSELGFAVGDEITISLDWKITDATTYGNFRLEAYNDSGYIGAIKNPVAVFSADNTSGHEEITYTLTAKTVEMNALAFRIDNSALTFTVSNCKIEKGNKATSWAVAQEDVQSNIDAAEANAINDTTTRLKAYSTTSEVDAKIEQTKDSITQSVSSTYTSKAEFENLSVGGRNLLRTTGSYDGWYKSNKNKWTFDGEVATVSNSGSTANVYYNIAQWIGDGMLASLDGKTLTISFDIKSDDWESVIEAGTYVGLDGVAVQIINTDSVPFGTAMKQRKYLFIRLNNTNYVKQAEAINGEWTRVILKPLEFNKDMFTLGTTTSDKGYDDYVVFHFQLRRNGTVSIRHIMIEESTTPSNWTTAPEDTESELTAIETRVSSAEQKITAEAIVSTVRSSDAYTSDLSGKTNNSEIISTINQSAEKIKIEASKVELTGAVTISSLDSSLKSTINTASTNATNAVSTANTASTNASSAVSTANTANTNASNAVTTAESAKTTAESAAKTASTASTNATNAINTANTASTTASTAKTTADDAKSAVDNMEIGGTNLIKNTKTMDGYSKSSNITFSEDSEGFTVGTFAAVEERNWNSIWVFPAMPFSTMRGKTVTFSMLVRSDDYENINADTYGVLCSFNLCSATSLNRQKYRVNQWYKETLSDSWTKLTATATLTDSFFTSGTGDIDDNTRFYMMVYNYTQYSAQVKKFKLEFGNKPTDWNHSPNDTEDAISDVADTNNGLGIKWNYSNYSTANAGEAYLCSKDPSTAVLSDANGFVMWDGVKRTVTKGMINPNTLCPYNRTIYIVCRLSSASATTGTNYLVWYNSGWKYLSTGIDASKTGASVTDWTWAESTDIILGSFVEPSSEGDFVDCQLYTPCLKSSQVTTGNSAYLNAANAQSTANTANAKATYHYGTCATAKGTVAKVVTLSGFSLYTGANVSVKFTNANSVASPTLNVNGTGAKAIYVYGSALTADSVYNWADGATVDFVYNGTQWEMTTASADKTVADWCYNNNKTYIDGGKLYTGTVTTNALAANSVTASKIDVTDLFAQDITATGTISGVTLKGASGEFTESFNADVIYTSGTDEGADTNENHINFGVDSLTLKKSRTGQSYGKNIGESVVKLDHTGIYLQNTYNTPIYEYIEGVLIRNNDLYAQDIYVKTKLSVGLGAGEFSNYALTASSFLCNSWVRTKGSTGWYSEDYGGGWYMTDTTWIRAFGGKSVYLPSGTLRTDGALQVGSSGLKIKFVRRGSSVISPSGTGCMLISLEVIKGWCSDISTGDLMKSNTAVFIANGDGDARSQHIQGCTAISTSKTAGWYATFAESVSGSYRVNWMIIIWD
jgi:hypothetical protein